MVFDSGIFIKPQENSLEIYETLRKEILEVFTYEQTILNVFNFPSKELLDKTENNINMVPSSFYNIYS